MARTRHEQERLREKADLVAARIKVIGESAKVELLIGMLPEWKLDLLLIAFGDGEVTIPS